MKEKSPRGNTLNYELSTILELMKKEGHILSPITRENVRRRLGLNSRSTLLLQGRNLMIEKAGLEQLQLAGLNAAGKKKRNSLLEEMDLLKKKNQSLVIENNQLIERFILLVNGLHAKGLNVEEFMLPLRSR